MRPLVIAASLVVARVLLAPSRAAANNPYATPPPSPSLVGAVPRATAADPAVLILDEATSALDQETEQRLLEGLLELRPARTIICVSHRASVARRADHILVLARGRLAAQGTYAELTAPGSHYRGLLVAI